MIVHEYHVEDLSHGPATLLDAARKLFDEHEKNKRARQERDLMLYSLADAVREGKAPELDEAALKAAAFLPAGPSAVLSTCSATFRPNPGAHADPAKCFGENLGMDCIQTAVIQAVGRFCVRHAADVLLDIAMFQPLDMLECQAVPAPGEAVEWVFAVGIREDGVDGNDYVMSNLRSSKRGTPFVYPSAAYRQLLAVYVRDEPDPDADGRTWRRAALVDLTHSLTTLHPDDERQN